MIKIIGIDPGLSSTGVGIVKGRGLKVQEYAFGSINTSKSNTLPERLNHIFSKLNSLLTDEKPDLMVIEDVFSLEKYPKSGINLGKVTGVILLSACHANIPVIEVAVREVKHVLTGNGNASKEQLELTVRRLLSLVERIKPFHASDAIALALLGLFRYKKEKMPGNNGSDCKV
ncbi:MAG: crossover junction endodeoxyribonuclease RuvC [Proteobacteria bacterium]|nr:crossover junction endodeoxyribonuclease RuvC [Pseudomonadota bacterium]